MTEHLSGDRRAVQQLLERHLPSLRAYVRLRAGAVIPRHESGSDLVQSVCRDVLENLDRFRYPGEAAFRAWLYATALRKIADHLDSTDSNYLKMLAAKGVVVPRSWLETFYDGRDVWMDAEHAFAVGFCHLIE